VSSAQALGQMRTLVQIIDEELRTARAGALAIATDLSSALFLLMLRCISNRRTRRTVC
jgi:hypothetical protein